MGAEQGLSEGVASIAVSAYTVPTDAPEADGTYEWNNTTIVIVHARASGRTGLGYTYADTSTAHLIEHHLAGQVLGADPTSPRAAWNRMYRSVRNLGRDGIASMAISAVDMALWDLKARILGVAIVDLLGALRDSIMVYGSGGFTSYSDEQLRRQLGGWTQDGIRAVKMKIGTHPEQDAARVRAARQAIGDAELYVDANGAYTVKQSLEKAAQFADCGVTWFEEPVSSDDLAGLRFIREHAPAPMDIAAGEYGYNQQYFQRMLAAEAVDVIQADGTRCGGVTGFLKAADEADGFQRPLSAHTSPSLHGHLCCAAPRARNVEYFHDHARIEKMLFDGALVAKNGVLKPDRSSPGFGLTLKETEARRYQVYRGEKHA